MGVERISNGQKKKMLSLGNLCNWGTTAINFTRPTMPRRTPEYMLSQRLRFCEGAMVCFRRKGIAATNLNDMNRAGSTGGVGL